MGGIGQKLRESRLKWQLTLREVEERSSQLAQQWDNPSYKISASWLDRVEREDREVAAAKMIVLAVIYGLHWLLKNSRSGRKSDRNDLVEVIATTPLAQNRSIHLVRAGDELLLVGAAESGVTPLRVYAAGEPLTAALEAGAPPPVLELPPPAVEAAPPARGLVPRIKSWTVRT